MQNTYGFQVRNDDITTLGLYHTQARARSRERGKRPGVGSVRDVIRRDRAAGCCSPDARDDAAGVLAAQCRHADAQATEIVICPGVGFDVIPTDCVAAASGQINLRNVDGWQTLTIKPIDQPIDLAA